MILGTVPLALSGAIWLMYLLEFNFSVAVAVGFIALAGIAVEIGIIMLVYLNQSYDALIRECQTEGVEPTSIRLQQAVMQGAGMRARPVMMTSATIILGLLPILFGTGTGSEVMSRIAAPMVGGMVSALFLTLLVIPVIYYQWKKRQAADN